MSVRKSQLQRDKKCWSKEQDKALINPLIIIIAFSRGEKLNADLILSHTGVFAKTILSFLTASFYVCSTSLLNSSAT